MAKNPNRRSKMKRTGRNPKKEVIRTGDEVYRVGDVNFKGVVVEDGYWPGAKQEVLQVLFRGYEEPIPMEFGDLRKTGKTRRVPAKWRNPTGRGSRILAKRNTRRRRNPSKSSSAILGIALIGVLAWVLSKA